MHRVNAQIYTIRPVDEEQLFEDVKRLYKDLGRISTSIILDKFDIDFGLALKIMARVINED